ncbi:hypothetical protein [Bacillus subtilis]|uniref:hypothetical protein n=1 Tax=Bacillus subtilis TaxID=1423 RepID=UPI003F86EA6C
MSCKLRDQYTRQAFEVEDIGRRDNYTFIYNPYDQSVETYDTSRKDSGLGFKRKLVGRSVKEFPFECDSAYSYFVELYRKATLFEGNNDIYFIGWVHPDHGYSLDEEPVEDIKKKITNFNLIRDELREKYDQLAGCIEDPDVRSVFRQHVFIAGGCIASMIRGDEPKDFDFFLNSKDALYKVVEYFVSQHNQRSYDDSELSVSVGDDGKVNLSVPGGYVKMRGGSKTDPVSFSPTAITFPNDLQLIVVGEETEREMISKFDFVHTMAYYKPNLDEFFIDEDAFSAASDNKLVYNITDPNPIGAAKRLLRFVQRGWEIDHKEHMKILLNVNRVKDEGSFGELKEYTFM